jgi:hypothetical protein
MVKQRIDIPTRMRSGFRMALAAAALACGVAGAGEPAPCTATAGFDVEHAVVGQQVGYHVRIARRHDVLSVDWVEPPTFPGFHAEWLPDIAEPADASAPTRSYEERRALFPERAGTLSPARAQLRCQTGEEVSIVVVPHVTLRVEPPPTRDRPSNFAGLVGALAVERVITPQPASLGESIRVAVMLRGEGKLWIVDDPMAPIAAADVFRRRPRTSLDTGARLTVKRHFVYDIVPLRAGELEIPAIHVAYFDAAHGRFNAVRTKSVTVTVEAAASATAPDAKSRAADAEIEGETIATQTTATNAPVRSRVNLPGIAVAVIAAIAIAFVLRRRLAGRRRIAAAATSVAAIPDGSGEAEAIARALRLAIAPHVEGVAAQTAEELGAKPGLPEGVSAAVRLLAEAERARFDPTAEIPDRDTVRDAIERLSHGSKHGSGTPHAP